MCGRPRDNVSMGFTQLATLLTVLQTTCLHAHNFGAEKVTDQ